MVTENLQSFQKIILTHLLQKFGITYQCCFAATPTSYDSPPRGKPLISQLMVPLRVLEWRVRTTKRLSIMTSAFWARDYTVMASFEGDCGYKFHSYSATMG